MQLDRNCLRLPLLPIYRVAGYMVYSGVLMLFPALIVLGMFFGILGRKADAAPTERSFMSNAGGIFLMA